MGFRRVRGSEASPLVLFRLENGLGSSVDFVAPNPICPFFAVKACAADGRSCEVFSEKPLSPAEALSVALRALRGRLF